MSAAALLLLKVADRCAVSKRLASVLYSPCIFHDGAGLLTSCLVSGPHTLLPWRAYRAGAGVCWAVTANAACGGPQGGSQWSLCAACCSSQALNPTYICNCLLLVSMHKTFASTVMQAAAATWTLWVRCLWAVLHVAACIQKAVVTDLTTCSIVVLRSRLCLPGTGCIVWLGDLHVECWVACIALDPCRATDSGGLGAV